MIDLPTKFFDVLVHTNELLIVQTHAGATTDDISNRYGDFNLGLHVNDNPEQVLANRGHLLRSINDYLTHASAIEAETKSLEDTSVTSMRVDSLYWLNQTHSNQVVFINKKGNIAKTHSTQMVSSTPKPANGLTLIPPSADALITNKSKTALAIMTADCVPIVLYDTDSDYIATIHAGWQGLANGVIAQTVAALKQAGASDDIQAWIGVCISTTCYEVSTEVVDTLLRGCQAIGIDGIDLDKTQLRSLIVKKHTNPNKAWLDLSTLAAYQLAQLQVTVNTYLKTECSGDDLSNLDSHTRPSFAYDCSYSNNKYYSYRRTTHQGYKDTGRMAMIAVRLDALS